MSGVDHAHIARLLKDDSLSYREIARQVGCSDWTVRSIARALSGDERPMKGAGQYGDGADLPLWPVAAALLAFIGGAVWLATRRGGWMP